MANRRKTKTSRPAAVGEFLEAVPSERHALVEALDEVIRGAAPQLAVALHGRMLGYGLFHYKYASGREGDTFVVSMMNGAQALSLYLSGGQGDQYLAEANALRLATGAGRLPVGKSCIRVKKLEHIDLSVLAELVAVSAAQHAEALIS